MKNKKIHVFLFLAVMLYSVVSIFSKLASGYPLPSFSFLAFYGCSLLVLAVYAVAWQYVLTKLPLSTAYIYKGYTYVFTLIWAVLIFKEKLTWNQIVGMVIIVAGVMICQSTKKEKKEKS